MSYVVAYLKQYYAELKNQENIRLISLEDIEEELLKRSNKTNKNIMNDYAMYEILKLKKSYPSEVLPSKVNRCYVNRMFLDIEKLPYGDYSIVESIVKDFINYLKEIIPFYSFEENKEDVHKYIIKDRRDISEINFDYVVTHNQNSSSHDGDSYHIIFTNICIYHSKQIKAIVDNFLKMNEEYIPYVDDSVYSSRRLFRLPFSRNVGGRQYKNINEDDIHKPYGETITKENISRYIIQNVDYNKCSLMILERTNEINYVQLIRDPLARYSGNINNSIATIVDTIIANKQGLTVTSSQVLEPKIYSDDLPKIKEEVEKKILLELIIKKQIEELKGKDIKELREIMEK